MPSWIVILLLALLVWTPACAWLWLFKRRRTEAHHGLAALAGMRWREFSQIVRRAMVEQRGLAEPASHERGDRGTSSDFLMEREGRRWLLSCKHGRAYRIGAPAIRDLGAALRLTGATGGILITEGRVERDGLAAAAEEAIEVLDGRVLWPLLAPCVADDVRARVVGIARRQALRQTLIAALAALAVGLVAGVAWRAFQQVRPSTPAAVVPGAPAPAASRAAAPVPSAAHSRPADAPVPTPAEHLEEDPDPATLLRYQQAVSRALARTPGIISGIWLTRSTLSVERSVDDATAWPLICREVEHYPALRTARIQLNPRPGSGEPVRWRQCRTL
ncbi:restriction endonuclease [Stenotrophomonas mori]|uniref:Restriction endonuclease n=1 Tax=Stenotrophomonas mori TaxID=2871096 RepID=A0ABT0SEW3_9GAMM|nr:restriction endonuclease [Stenotrophomonas mori]MCL7713864.1 restriction endonuclease [Stenotrophomonas mori]